MSRDGSGNYSLPEAPFVFDTVISETAVNSNFSDIAAALTASIAKDGQTTPTANLPMGGYKHTGVTTSSGSSSRSEYLAAATAQDGGIWDAGETGGTSTAYTATLSPSITAYADKQCFRVKFNAACGAEPTINFNSVGAKKIYKNTAGSAAQLEAGDIQAGQVWHLRYDSSLDSSAGGFCLLNFVEQFVIDGLSAITSVDYLSDKVPVYDASASGDRSVIPAYLLGLMRGHVYGLTLSNNTTDANNDIDIAAGQAVDNTSLALMVLASGITKRLDANWAVGNNQGGLDTGSKANSTWYYVWLIQRSDTGVVDVLFSTSKTSPTMPTDYDRKARIPGAILTDSSGNIKAFVQVGRNRFDWVEEPNEWDVTNPGTATVLRTLLVPPNTIARLIIGITNGSTNANYYRVWETWKADVVLTAAIADLSSQSDANVAVMFTSKEVGVDAASQVRTRVASSGSSDRIFCKTMGFIDPEF